MNMTDFDVIVVGAGPAGLSTGRFSARHGLKTAIIEAKNSVKAWKPCGEAISKATLKTAEVDPFPGLVTNEVKMRVYAPNGNFVEINEHGYAINKDVLLEEMAAQAAGEGATFYLGEKVQTVKRVSNGMRVITSRGEYGCRIVVGADGLASRVARVLGLNNRVEVIPTAQYKMANCKIDEDYGQIYLGSDIAPKGYAWIFPKGRGIANVGLGVRGASVLKYLDKLMHDHPDYFKDAKVIGFGAAAVPIGGLARDMVDDNVILVGDTAGTVIPFTGAGIHSSIAAGKIAAEVMAKSISEGDYSKEKLKEYVAQYDVHWGRRIKDSLRAMRVFEKLSDHEFNLLADILDEKDIVNIANGINLGSTIKKLSKHPILAAKIVRALI